MAKARRARKIDADPAEVWELVSDPWHLPRWWPAVSRVEEATPEAWTKVLRSPKGKSLRADYTRTRYEPPTALGWRQEVEESPFERILREATTDIELAPADGGTHVELRATSQMRGLSRLGWVMVRRVLRRRLDEALDGLEAAVGRGRPG